LAFRPFMAAFHLLPTDTDAGFKDANEKQSNRK
jgi:hypothetical protein